MELYFTPTYIFMAQYLVKHSDNFTVTLMVKLCITKFWVFSPASLQHNMDLAKLNSKFEYFM